MPFGSSVMMALREDDADMVQSSSATEPMLSGMGEAAFQIFYQQTSSMLRSYIRRAANDAALADDISQEAFLRFLRTCPAGLEERQQKAYLYRTATSLLVDHWRRAKRERRWSLLNWFDDKKHNQISTGTEMGTDMTRLFAQLRPQEQALLWMAYVEGFDHSEIAAALELSEKSVRVLLFRARKKMAGILTSVGIGPQGEI